MLDVNMVLRAAPDCEILFPGFARLVGVSTDGSACLIRLDASPLKAPFYLQKSALIEAIIERSILPNQVFQTGLPVSKDQLSQNALASVGKFIDLMRPLIEDERLLFNSKTRGREFTQRALECGVNVRLVHRLYYRYLWGGQTELAFAPLYHLRGGSGVLQKEGTTRRGRKSADSTEASEVALPQVRAKLEKGGRLFYLTGKHTLKESYVITLKRYFSVGAKLGRDSDKNVKLDEILPPTPELPTYWQFRYICRQLEQQEGKRSTMPRRVREREPNWEFRGKSRQSVPGPGFRFEIDATKLQIQLVSRYGRANIVGSPTLYLIIDVWSGAIVGYAISLENAGWALAARALHNCFQSKNLVFERLGLPYEEEDWPCHHLPSRLAADRAELVSDKAGMVPMIGIKVEIMPPMSPESKGKIESAIKDIKHGDFYDLPGRYCKFLKRREQDGKRSAALNIIEMEKIIVEIIMDLNNDPVPIEYVPHEMMKESETTLTHIGLYKWGLKHRPGYTRILPQKEVYTNLLARDQASITARGIYYKGQTYVSNRLHEGGYLARASNDGHYKVEIRLDEHLADQVWFLDNINNEWVPAQNDNEEIRRLKVAFYEVESFRMDARQSIDKAKAENIHKKDEKDKGIKQTVSEAKKQTNIAKGEQPKSKSKKAIRHNRSIEKEANRLLEEGQTQTSYSMAITKERETGKQNHKQDLTNSVSTHVGTLKPSITQRSKELWGNSK